MASVRQKHRSDATLKFVSLPAVGRMRKELFFDGLANDWDPAVILEMARARIKNGSSGENHFDL